MTRFVTVFFAVLLVTGCFLTPNQARAQGGPPMITEDPGTPGPGRWELNTAATFEGNAGSYQWEAPLLDLNYGLGDRIQLKLEIPFMFLSNGATHSGFGATEFGIKYRLVEGSNRQWAVSVYPQLVTRTFLSSDDQPFGDIPTELRLPAQFAWSSGQFTASFETGYQIVESEQDFWLLGGVAGYEAAPGMELLGEVHATFGQDLNTAEPLLNVGAALEVTPQFILMGSAGRLWPDQGDGVFIAYTGIQLLL